MKSNLFESIKQPNQLDRNRTSHLQHHLKINAEEINSMTSQLKRPNRLLQKKLVPWGKMNVTVSSYIEDTRLGRYKTLKVFSSSFLWSLLLQAERWEFEIPWAPVELKCIHIPVMQFLCINVLTSH